MPETLRQLFSFGGPMPRFRQLGLHWLPVNTPPPPSEDSSASERDAKS